MSGRTDPTEVPRLRPEDPLTALRGIGPVRAAALGEAGYDTVADLLWHLPLRYEDRRQVRSPADIRAEGSFALVGRVRGLRSIRVRRRRLALVRGRVEDGDGSLAVIWFNRPYAVRQLSEDRDYFLFGRVRRGPAGLELVNPTCEPAESALAGSLVAPIYSAVGGLGPASVRKLVGRVVDGLALPDGIDEALPPSLLELHGLPRLGVALETLHRPPASADLGSFNDGESRAHRRLVYGEMLELQLRVALARAKRERTEKAYRYRVDARLRRRLEGLPPFTLTAAQRRSLGEILGDLHAAHPILRRLQGDVASGKTVVAALALLAAVDSGLQGALMAPTELLAEQHFRSLERLLGEHCGLALVTRTAADVERSRQRLARGEVDVAVGTHSLIQEGVRFRRLGLTVIDEQHRFGVGQRRLLQLKGENPDLLVMTATPIPRSLALTVYGDLSLSILDELPPGRTPVDTRLVAASSRAKVYDWLRGRVARGGQAYVVFPLIADSRHLEAASIARLGRAVRRRLRGIPTAVLHGRISAQERETLMRAFVAGEVRVLIATTVIEVGVDVPTATVMVIESAERFGLAQLHQLRGRVGRGGERSVCVAVHGRLGEMARRRLELFADTTDGFELAEADLRLRGPGELLGTRQTGFPAFRVADLLRDRQWIERARSDAERMLAERPQELEALLRRLAVRRSESRVPFAGG